MGASYALEAKNISFRFNADSDYLLHGVNIQVKSGEVVGIIGMSGSGKTTLINILNGIIPQHLKGELSGIVEINGESIAGKGLSELAEAIGTVFQNPDDQIIFSCVEDEIAFGPENLCVDEQLIIKRIEKICSNLNINNLRYRNPNNLSGGEKQLVVIAAVLSLDVSILLLDECMSQVDEPGRKLILSAIHKLKQQGKAIIMVEHQFNNLAYADRVYALRHGKLQLIQGELNV